MRTLAVSDVQVPGGWPVHFLFPVCVPVTDQPVSEFTVASTNIVGMRLEPEPRVRRLAELGATMASTGERVTLASRLRAALPDWGELRAAVGYSILAILTVSLLMVVTLLLASLVLMLGWYVLGWVASLVGPG